MGHQTRSRWVLGALKLVSDIEDRFGVPSSNGVVKAHLRVCDDTYTLG